jgi:predicted helicase
MPDDSKPDGNLVSNHVSGKMTAYERDLRIRQLDQLEDTQRGLLSNARCLGEGIDVPTLDGVAFIDTSVRFDTSCSVTQRAVSVLPVPQAMII